VQDRDGKHDGRYSVGFSCGGGKSDYSARVGRWNDAEFADVESVSVRQALDQEADAFMVRARSFCRIRHDGDFLWLAYLSSDWAQDNFPPSVWSEFNEMVYGDEKGTAGLVFTGSTEQLQRLVLEPSADRTKWVEFRFAKVETLAAA